MAGYSPVNGGGLQRTDLYCHNCDKNFIAELNFDINGDHIIECAYCGHEHCRTIKDGEITSSRWAGRNDSDATRVNGSSVWKSSVIKAQTSTVSTFIRDAWLNRST